ncbi:MAG: NADPH-dependent glutamate synthase [Lachnospira sp.]
MMDVMKKVPVREQAPDVRNKNFDEVCLGYNMEEATEEATRCLNCKNAKCIEGCPVSINIPEFIHQVKEGNIAEAYKVIGKSSALPAICGRVCPQETQCEGKCIRGIKGEAISIGKLERFVADWARENKVEPEMPTEKKGKKVAVIGSGPSGLTCAGDLAKMGYDVTIFEALHEAGGVLVYGIPEFRLPKKTVVASEIENVKKLGVKIETNVVIGKSMTIDQLIEEEGFSAVFIGSGAGLPKFMGIPGENANGVFSANEYLTRSNLMKAFKDEYDTPIARFNKVAVVGGGNVAMDAARTALRLGAEVHIVYRRSEEELPARAEEVHHAKEEGIIFDLLTNPVEIINDEKGNVTGMKCVKMELGEPDASGRRKPVEVPGSEFIMELDAVIMSLGTSPNPLISSTTKGLEINKRQCIVAEEENGKTSKDGVYAGGDAVTGAATVILAMGAGKAAAKGIDEYLSGK